MARCPQCGGNVPASAISTAAYTSGIACPHCGARLQARLRSRLLMNLVSCCFAAGVYGVLLLAGVNRGPAFAIGLLVAVSAGFLLLRFTRLTRKIKSMIQ